MRKTEGFPMKKENRRMKKRFLLMISLCIFSTGYIAYSQTYKWLRVSELQSPFNAVGAEFELEFSGIVGRGFNYLAWQPQYDIDQSVERARGFWIGCKNFNDPVQRIVKPVKVIGAGPKTTADLNQIFPQSIRLIGKYRHPNVVVDDAESSTISSYDVLDEVDPNLPCDRMIVIKFNTSMGISVTKKVMVFSQSNHGNYFIYDYVFKNTGIIDAAGSVQAQALDSVWFFWNFRHAFGGVSSLVYNPTWGAQAAQWGLSTLYHAFGENPGASTFTDPASPLYKLRGYYSYFSPMSSTGGNPQGLTYNEDWGCPNLSENGELASAKYAGCVTLHADKSSQDATDDESQPRTTYYISPDINILSSATPSQYDDAFMNDRWAAITEGHPVQQWDEVVGTTGSTYAETVRDPRRNTGGGASMDQGYGPYQMAIGDSVHIVFAEAVSGIGWEKGREVGANWLQWRSNNNGPALILPDGSTTTDFNEYKKTWIFTGRDSILKSYQIALSNYQSGYSLPQAPPPPNTFTITSGGDRIQLSWANNAISAPHFGGYVIYRAEGLILNWRSVYTKIYETSDPNVVTYDDTTAHRGNDYFYYIQSKDDGTQVSGKTLYSSLFWTLTNTAALLGRPAGNALEKVRVVPNPYDIRSRVYQYGVNSQYDRIAFYGLPPKCKLKIFTENGELIWQKDHVTPTGDEVWDSKTSSGQIIVSGIYVLYVEVAQDTYDTWMNKDSRLLYKKGDSVFRKFVVIR
jgi:hypothetical protein